MRLGRRGELDVERASSDPRRFRWPTRLAALLGRVPDPEVARRAGVSLKAVVNERHRRGIGAWRKPRPTVVWTEAMVKRFGSDTDANVAAALRVHRASVTRKRIMLRIPAFVYRGPRPEPHWTAHALALLGTASDLEVARRLKLSVTAVNWRRRRLGIKSFKPARPKVLWTKPELRLLGRVSDVEAARRLGIDKATVKSKREQLGIPPYDWRSKPIARTRRLKALLRLTTRELWEEHGLWPGVVAKLRREYGIATPDGHVRRWTKALLARLGKEPDTELALAMGVTSPAVRAKRRSLGIARWTPPERRWTKRERALLGKLPDPEIARRLRLAVYAVKRKRWELGISPALARRS
jgi:hypothetical protein